MSGFTSHAERIDAQKIRARSASFFDHFSQATLFFNSQTQSEQNHIIRALRFELGKVETPGIRERMLSLLSQIDKGLANRVAEGLGATVPARLDKPINMSIPADGDPKKFQPKRVIQAVETSPALSMVENPNFPKDNIKTRKIAFLVADGVDDAAVSEMKQALMTAGAAAMTVAPRLGTLTGSSGEEIKADFSFLTGSSVLFDAVYVPGGEASVSTLRQEPDAVTFIKEAYTHCKTIAATEAGAEFVRGVLTEKLGDVGSDDGVILGDEGFNRKTSEAFIAAMAKHRHWKREEITQPLAKGAAVGVRKGK